MEGFGFVWSSRGMGDLQGGPFAKNARKFVGPELRNRVGVEDVAGRRAGHSMDSKFSDFVQIYPQIDSASSYLMAPD